MSATAARSSATASQPDPRTAIGRARIELRRAAAKAELEGDPLGGVLEAFETSLGAMGELLDYAEANRQPMDASARAEIMRALIAACRADFVRVAGFQARRTAVLAGLAGAVLLLGALGAGYFWGRSTQAAEVREASGVIRAALSDGSASARAWADAIRRNDLVGLLARCEGRAVWTDVSGRRACAVPLWLEDAPPPGGAGRTTVARMSRSPRTLLGTMAVLRCVAWLLLGPLLHLGQGPARILLVALGQVGIVCGFAGVLGVRLALDAGQSLGEPLLMI